MSIKPSILFAAIAIIAVSLSGCTKKESDQAVKLRLENTIINSCMSEAKKLPNTQSEHINILREYCSCSVAELFKNYSLDEVRAIEDADIKNPKDLEKLNKMIQTVSATCASQLKASQG